MNSDDYARKQSAKDAEYERQYREWIESLPAEDRKKVDEAGLGKPMLARHGNGSPDQDLADSPLASHTPDIAALVDHEPVDCTSPEMAGAIETLQHLVADLISEGNTRLTIECLAVALGLSAYEGESMTDIARRHGISRAAVSKRCVDITTHLNLPPSRAMRSEMARKTYRNSRTKHHKRKKHAHPYRAPKRR